MATASDGLQRLVELMRRLRAPDGCPWDRRQTLDSLQTYLIEEAYEVLEAIERNDFPALREELGDLLFQIVFQCQVASEAGAFDIYEVIDAIAEKIVRRHPHVFGSERAEDAEQVVEVWERVKREEKSHRGPLDGIPKALPALLAAQRLSERAARLGFDWERPDQVLEKVHEEVNELQQAWSSGGEPGRLLHEIGDLMFALVNLARHLGASAEDILRSANRRFRARFAELLRLAELRHLPIEQASLEQLEQLWQSAKRNLEGDGNT